MVLILVSLAYSIYVYVLYIINKILFCHIIYHIIKTIVLFIIDIITTNNKA